MWHMLLRSLYYKNLLKLTIYYLHIIIISIRNIFMGGDILAKEIIDKILESEDRSNKIIEYAKKEAQSIIDDAKRKSDAIIKESYEYGKNEQKELLNKADRDANTAIEKKRQEKDDIIAGLNDIVEKNMNDAVNLICERIVGTYVGS